jgi:hypothetical protein
MPLALSTVIVLVFGALVGIGELITRYRDKPTNALKLPSSIFYICVNAAASGGGLGMVHGFGWTFGQSGTSAQITQVLVAGFGSAALFRSSLFTVRVGTTDVGIGPSAVLDSILAAADRATDRELGVTRSETITKILGSGQPPIDSDKAIAQLPPYCLALMQNLSAPDQEALGAAVAKIDANKTFPPDEKLDLLLLSLINAVGAEVVTNAVQRLRPSIQV